MKSTPHIRGCLRAVLRDYLFLFPSLLLLLPFLFLVYSFFAVLMKKYCIIIIISLLIRPTTCEFAGLSACSRNIDYTYAWEGWTVTALRTRVFAWSSRPN